MGGAETQRARRAVSSPRRPRKLPVVGTDEPGQGPERHRRGLRRGETNSFKAKVDRGPRGGLLSLPLAAANETLRVTNMGWPQMMEKVLQVHEYDPLFPGGLTERIRYFLGESQLRSSVS